MRLTILIQYIGLGGAATGRRYGRPTLGLRGGLVRSLAARLVRHRELRLVASAAPSLAVSVSAKRHVWSLTFTPISPS